MVRVISFTGLPGGYFKVRTRTSEDEKTALTDASFFSFDEARLHVSTVRRMWLLDAFTSFVKHKGIIYRTSAGDHYRVPMRLNALTRLENAIEILPSKTTDELCSIIIKSENLLRSVLPHEANPSYEPAVTKINQMIQVANDELSNKLGIFPFKSTSTERFYS